MKWLKIEYIKQHSRIDFDCEDALLELYGKAAEEMVCNVCGRTYEEFVADYGDVPDAIRQASLMLVDNSYTQRSPVSMQNLYTVPYTFDFLVKPYIKMTPDEETETTTE